MAVQPQDNSRDAKEHGALTGGEYEAEDVFENAEPWDPIETKIVLASFGAAVILLIVFGYLINTFVLH